MPTWYCNECSRGDCKLTKREDRTPHQCPNQDGIPTWILIPQREQTSSGPTGPMGQGCPEDPKGVKGFQLGTYVKVVATTFQSGDMVFCKDATFKIIDKRTRPVVPGTMAEVMAPDIMYTILHEITPAVMGFTVDISEESLRMFFQWSAGLPKTSWKEEFERGVKGAFAGRMRAADQIEDSMDLFGDVRHYGRFNCRWRNCVGNPLVAAIDAYLKRADQ